ncbi:MAG: universal stress protein [Alphaproteobacteria bacterium]|nr:universal stress protein [Alphaproteobacteria bacterium]
MNNAASGNQSTEKAGSTRKWLVVLDDTEECAKAVTFAAYRARRTGDTIALLVVIEPGQFQHWIGVEDIMRAEAMEAADKLFERYEALTSDCGKIPVVRVVREGKQADQIEALIAEDSEIVILVLAAGTSSEGPGPLVTSIAERGADAFPIPVVIVPGKLSNEQIEALS